MKAWNIKRGKQDLLINKNSIQSFETNDCEYEVIEFEILPEKIICPDCGGITLSGLDFCDKCAGELSNYELN